METPRRRQGWASTRIPLSCITTLLVSLATSAGAESEWIGRAQQDIAAREYELSWQARPGALQAGHSWQAPNRAHGLRAHFLEQGIEVVPRTETDPSWTWSLTLVGYGRGATLWPVGAAGLAAAGNRIDYRRGTVDEWYVNDDRGLKQGFHLWASPEEVAQWDGAAPLPGRLAAPGRSRWLETAEKEMLVHLDLALSGNLMPVISADGQAIDFVIPGGARALRYAELVVTDATGRRLPSWMEGVTDDAVRGIRLVVDDREAVYPIVVDPLATSPAWQVESDQGGALFGYRVGTAGDVNGDGYADVIVGAYAFDAGQTNEGRAFVYLGSASGLATAPWTAEIDLPGAQFGAAVGTAGDVNGDGYADVIVGANQVNGGQAGEGRAYVYLGSAAGLSTTPAWTAESNQANALFGSAVGTAGDVNGDGYSDVIVGAFQFDNQPADNEGSAFAYLGSAAGLATTPAWVVTSGTDGALFGYSVGTAGDVNGDGYADVIVGAYQYTNGEASEGRAYAYLGSAAGLSTTPAWTVESNSASAQLGHSVLTAGDVNGDGYADVIVGAPGFDGGQTDEGQALVFLGSAAGLGAAPTWAVESNSPSAQFGNSVGTAGDVNGDGYADVIVGAYQFTNGQANEGLVSAYFGSASGLSLTSAWTVESNSLSAQLGVSVGTAGDVNGDGYADVIAGAYGFDNAQTDEGQASTFLGSAAGLSTESGWTAESNQASASFGSSVGTAGDVNGDGYADVIVGASLYDNGQAEEGRAYVYLGSAAGLSTTPAWTAEINQASALFGYSVGTAGDVNGDGYADVVVGAYAFDNGQTDEGRAYVYLGSAAGLSTSPAWMVESNSASAQLGVSVGTAGDVNGDGYADVIAGANGFDNGQTDEGRAYVYLGSAAGPSTMPAWTVESNATSALFGTSVGTAGDVNGDGYADVIVGAPGFDGVLGDEGRAYAYLGSAAGLSTSPASVLMGVFENVQAGTSVGTAGDVNGDGYADVIVGWPGMQSARAYHGSPAGLSLSPSWLASQPIEEFGRSVGTAGDVNGDGYSDVIVGAFGFDNQPADNEGSAFAYLGSAAGLATTPAWMAGSGTDGALFGNSVGTAGDVNGDGYADVIVGAHQFNGGQVGEGGAFVYHGNGTAGLSVRPRQRRADDLAPIAPGGRSRIPGSFRVAALGRSPFGRAAVRLEVEAKGPETPFDGTGTLLGADWEDTSTAGAALGEIVSGLEPGRYRWRARFRYDPASSPFQQASRWFTVPWNGWHETDVILGSFLGGVVWEDRDRDGIRDVTEPRLWGVVVQLLDSGGTALEQTTTDSQGGYHFEIPDDGEFRLRFVAPTGYLLTLRDQGDDALDSDANTVTGQTVLISPPHLGMDSGLWGAGMYPQGLCFVPDEPLYIGQVTLSPEGFPILHFQDGNQPSQVTGYNVYRSSDAGAPFSAWSLEASNVLDMDQATPNKQWVDTSGDESPSSLWFYQVNAYNSVCDAEGPN